MGVRDTATGGITLSLNLHFFSVEQSSCSYIIYNIHCGTEGACQKISP